MTSNQPPSYAPKNSKSRPGSTRAEIVGNGNTPASVNSARRPRAPRAYPPASSSTTPRSGRQSQATRTPHSVRPPQSERTSQGMSTSQSARTSQSADVTTKRLSPKKIAIRLIVFLLVISLAWFIYLFTYGNSKLSHADDALSGREDTPGETYLIVGSDKREAGVLEDGWGGERADTIMILQLPDTGHAALISIPRDSLVEIPGYGLSKINAAYSWDGASLLVETVENLTGLTVDHYIEVSMGGVQNLVDAVGGVNACYDDDVSDEKSGMQWTAGCHDIDGKQALSFSRMRFSDPRGDIGRTDRQRQIVSKVIDKAVSSDTVIRPWRQRALVGAAAENLTTDPDTSILGLAQAGLGLKSVMGEGGLMGTPPISDMGYWYNGESCVQLDPDTIDVFWEKLARGELTSEDLSQI